MTCCLLPCISSIFRSRGYSKRKYFCLKGNKVVPSKVDHIPEESETKHFERVTSRAIIIDSKTQGIFFFFFFFLTLQID